MESASDYRIEQSEKDALRKKAVKAAFGLSCLRKFGHDPEMFDELVGEIKKGVDFCNAAQKAHKVTVEGSPMTIEEMTAWRAFKNIASPKEKMAMSLSMLNEISAGVEENLNSIIYERLMDEKILSDCERFFQRMVVVLE